MILTKTKPETRGFTLVELLVVISIIAALAALSFTVVTRMMAKSRTVTSVNNLKQLYIGAESFAGDHHGIFPATYWGDPDDNQAGKQIWWQALSPYVYNREDPRKLDGTFRDKADPRVRAISDGEERWGKWKEVSYMPWVNGTVGNTNPVQGISVTRTKQIGGQPYLSTALNTGSMGVWNEAQYNRFVVPSAEWRDNTIVVLYCDGAVQVIKNPTFEKVAPAMVPEDD